MRFPRLISKLYFEPLLVTAQCRMGLEKALDAHLSKGGNTGADGLPARPLEDYIEFNKRAKATTAQMRIDDVYETYSNVAVVKIDGVIDKHISNSELQCYGGCDLDDVQKALGLALMDDDIDTIVLAVNSPGGSVSGVPEMAAMIARASQQKDVIAYAETECCSAAYYIASQAGEVIAAPSAILGSIGVYLALLDESRALEMEGYRVELIKAGKYKAAGASFKPITPEEKALFQARVDDIYSAFTGAVRDARGDVDEDDMQGQVFDAEDAIAKNLADGIVESLDELVASLQ